MQKSIFSIKLFQRPIEISFQRKQNSDSTYFCNQCEHFLLINTTCLCIPLSNKPLFVSINGLTCAVFDSTQPLASYWLFFFFFFGSDTMFQSPFFFYSASISICIASVHFGSFKASSTFVGIFYSFHRLVLWRKSMGRYILSNGIPCLSF